MNFVHHNYLGDVDLTKKETKSQLRAFSIALSLVIMVQLLVGITLAYFGLAALAQLVHLWLASLLAGILLLIYTSLSYSGVKNG